MKIKVCGITTLVQLQQLQDLGVDYAGLIFYDRSKRFAHEKLKARQTEIRKLAIKKIGVFVNAGMDFLKTCVHDYGLSAVQLHGDESPEFCRDIQELTDVIKVFRISETSVNIDALLTPFQDCCSYFLFDTDTADYGGSGKRFDWTLVEKAAINKPFFLSGGIGPDDMDNLKSFSASCFYAVDVNSRFETIPGIKDMGKIETFVNTLKKPTWIK